MHRSLRSEALGDPLERHRGVLSPPLGHRDFHLVPLWLQGQFRLFLVIRHHAKEARGTEFVGLKYAAQDSGTKPSCETEDTRYARRASRESDD